MHAHALLNCSCVKVNARFGDKLQSMSVVAIVENISVVSSLIGQLREFVEELEEVRRSNREHCVGPVWFSHLPITTLLQLPTGRRCSSHSQGCTSIPDIEPATAEMLQLLAG